MFNLGKRPRPTDNPEIVPGFAPPAPEQDAAVQVAALDRVLYASGTRTPHAARSWLLLNRVLDERQVLAPAPPLPDDYPVLRPSVPVVSGGLGGAAC